MSTIQLSREFWAQCFLYLVEEDAPAYRTKKYIMYHPGWRTFLLVCRQWRDIAVTCGRAWARAFTQSPKGLHLIAARAKHYPRTIELGPECPSFTLEERWGWRQAAVNTLMDDIFELGNLHLAESIDCHHPCSGRQFAQKLLLSESSDLPSLRRVDLSSRDLHNDVEMLL